MNNTQGKHEGPPPVTVFRSLSYPETVLYAPPMLLFLLDLPALFLLLFLIVAGNFTPLIGFLVVPVHLLACSIGFREPHIATLLTGSVNASRMPRQLFP